MVATTEMENEKDEFGFIPKGDRTSSGPLIDMTIITNKKYDCAKQITIYQTIFK